MRPDDADKFAGADDFGFLPELWEMALIAGDQVVRAGGRVPQVALFYLGVLVFSQSRALLTARVFSGSAERAPVVPTGASRTTLWDRRVGSFSSPFSNFYLLVGRWLGGRRQQRPELAGGERIQREAEGRPVRERRTVVARGCFRVPRNPSRVHAKRRDHFLQADFPGLNAPGVRFVIASFPLTDGAGPSRDVKTMIARS